LGNDKTRLPQPNAVAVKNRLVHTKPSFWKCQTTLTAIAVDRFCIVLREKLSQTIVGFARKVIWLTLQSSRLIARCQAWIPFDQQTPRHGSKIFCKFLPSFRDNSIARVEVSINLSIERLVRCDKLFADLTYVGTGFAISDISELTFNRF
jgi:hypothetical protein